MQSKGVYNKVAVEVYSGNTSLALSTFTTRHLRLQLIVQLFCKKTTACHAVFEVDCSDCQSVSLENCCLNNRPASTFSLFSLLKVLFKLMAVLSKIMNPVDRLSNLNLWKPIIHACLLSEL